MKTEISNKTETKSDRKMKLLKELVAKNVANPTICCYVVEIRQ